MTDNTWVKRAECRTLDVEIFFPMDSDLAGQVDAKRICLRCPVQRECLDDAMRDNLKFGIWGGLTPKERRSLRLRQGRADRIEERPEPAVTEKTCPVCHALWPAEAFGRDSTTKDGLYWSCKKCASAAARRRRRLRAKVGDLAVW